ncbi:MAG TPA: site-2 protease family protein [Mycobacteriales bacterium]|nr:site-2 protease family protein [Mycobacteriales bacterium]
MIYAIGVAVFVVGLLVSVILHEAGHFLTAKAFGMKATKFFVGFGPTLWSRTRGETEYGVKAIPAGGFVKIVGMLPTEQLDPGETKHAFYRFKLWKRVVVLAAGSTMHFIIAGMLLLAFAFYSPQPAPGFLIRNVSACIPLSNPELNPTPVNGVCPDGSVPSPAAQAGLKPGDIVKAIGGHTLTIDDDPTYLLRSSSSASTTITYVRAGVATTIPVTLASVDRNVKTGEAGNQHAYALGVLPGDAGYVNPTWSSAWHEAGQLFGVGSHSLIGGIGQAVQKVPHRYATLFDKNQSADGPQSVVGIGQLSGSILAAKGVPLSYRVWALVSIVASVNFFVGVINLLPFLPFDGGHIAASVYDRVRGSWRRRRGRAAPGLASSYEKYAYVSYPVFAVIFIGSLLTLASNIANPIHL